MKELAHKKLAIVVFSVCAILFLYYLFYIIDDGLLSKFSYGRGISVLYDFSERTIFGDVLVTLLISYLVLDNFYKNKMSRFQNFIITRVGHKERLKYEIKEVLVSSFVVRLISFLFLMIVIHLFFSEINFADCPKSELYPDAIIAFVIYLFYSCIGFSIFSLFVYSVSYFLKNPYVFKVSPVLLYVVPTILVSALGNHLIPIASRNVINPVIFTYFTGYLLFPNSMIPTTVRSLFEVHFYYWYTCILFLIYSFILIFIRYSWEKKNG